jgi:hypothetical protein
VFGVSVASVLLTAPPVGLLFWEFEVALDTAPVSEAAPWLGCLYRFSGFGIWVINQNAPPRNSMPNSLFLSIDRRL